MDANLRAAFRATPRERFLPASQQDLAGLDVPLPIGFGVTNSQPSTVANMLQLLDAQPGQRVLDVGSGSGWTTALLAHLVGPRGEVLGVERIAELVTTSARALSDRPWASVQIAKADVFGLPDQAPFDRILVSAMADELPQELLDQLTTGGVLVVPVAGVMRRIVRQADGSFHSSTHGRYRFVPLIG